MNNVSKLSFFKTDRYEFKNKNICDFKNIPRPHFCMGLIIKGDAVFESDGENVGVSAGDIIFVPITSRYVSTWVGKPDILYISMHFAFEPSCGISEKNRFGIQRVVVDDFDDMKKKFEFVYNNYNADLQGQLSAMGEFYKILGNILPGLEKKEVQFYDKRIEKAMEYINMNSEKDFSVEELARISSMSISNFYSQFKHYTGMTPVEYKNNICISRACRLLKADRNLQIEEISELVGFESSAYFRRVFKRLTGKTPYEYKKSEPGI